MLSSIRTMADRLRQQASEDPKKAVALAVLVVVMGGLWARATLGSRPASASASPSPAAVAAPAVAEATEPASTGTSARAVASPELKPWLAAPLRTVDRNLFRIAYEHFPRSPGSGQENGEDLAKSVGGETDVKKERQILVANLRAQAATLRLQTTMMGETPKAMVDGKLVQVGDVVASFRVAEIAARGIIVEREGIRLEVQMK